MDPETLLTLLVISVVGSITFGLAAGCTVVTYFVDRRRGRHRALDPFEIEPLLPSPALEGSHR